MLSQQQVSLPHPQRWMRFSLRIIRHSLRRVKQDFSVSGSNIPFIPNLEDFAHA